MNLGELGEFGFIDRIAPLGIVRAEGVVKGIGDDCAVISLPGPDDLLITTDLLVEDVHFMMGWASAETLGAKALTVNLSDIAACGGTPRDAFVSLAAPDRVSVEWLEGLYKGMREVAAPLEVNILGGDTTASGNNLMISVTVTGLVPKGQALFRHTARPGHIIALTGKTGESAAGCDLLLAGASPEDPRWTGLIRRHLQPRAHVREGRSLASSGLCAAAIDVSDGLSSDLHHLCEASGVAAVIREELLPVAEELAAAARELGKVPLDWALHGGENYVLLCAVQRDGLAELTGRASGEGWRLFPVGEFVEGSGMELVDRGGGRKPLNPLGWDHFR